MTADDIAARPITIKRLADWLPNVGAKWIVFDSIGVGAFAISRAVLVAGVRAAKIATRDKRSTVTIEISGKAVHIRWAGPLRRGGLTLANQSTVDPDTGFVSVTEYRLPRGAERERVWDKKAKGHFSRYLFPEEYERVVVPPAPAAAA